jgi:predicted nuclease of restriction endonuclease-like (RecB) superfamily
MRTFAEAYPDEHFVQEALAQITWYHNITLLDKVKNPKERESYIRETIANGWGRDVLTLQIQSGLYERQGKTLTNFELALPKTQSDLAQNLLKDPYNFDFLGLGQEAHELDVELVIMEHIHAYFLELCAGFAFVGNQFHLEVGGEDFFIDQLFYHLMLRCFVVLELKATGFRPEYLGKLNFYLSAVDDLLRHEADALTIELLLCREHNHLVAEYALRDIHKPIGVSA